MSKHIYPKKVESLKALTNLSTIFSYLDRLFLTRASIFKKKFGQIGEKQNSKQTRYNDARAQRSVARHPNFKEKKNG
jgi:hypothetical protein